ncbi:hypothetical protein D2T29_12500 [Sinirhodobacter populi]|uniref:Restriction alleviation protein, Lar family n=1 Tax=Paenirhodobacter populi TaxID=2306993 RepID=A0A443KCH0_9RHOB|nr:hypothetical protein [Sinirhodobacter populi]RWR30484.1 hypothetical protein D2T29_12500 [Sinirhodobacter populi]
MSLSGPNTKDQGSSKSYGNGAGSIATGNGLSQKAFPTEAQIADACLNRQHDFGLMNGTDRLIMMEDALEWLRAWRRALKAGHSNEDVIDASAVAEVERLRAEVEPLTIGEDVSLASIDTLNQDDSSGELVSREALLPCPFCGGEASPDGCVTYGGNPNAWWADGTPVETAYFCNCIKCGIRNQGIVGGYQTREAAIAAWNTRALPATGQDKAEVERLRGAIERLTISEDVSRASIDTLKHTYNQLFEAMQSEQEDHTKTAAERDALRVENSELKRQLFNMTAVAQERHSERDALRGEKAKLEALMAKLVAAIQQTFRYVSDARPRGYETAIVKSEEILEAAIADYTRFKEGQA